MSDTFNIIFRGTILPGNELPDVKAKIAALFKLDEAKIAVVFGGKAVVLKKNCDAVMAEKLKVALNKAGIEIEVVAQVQASSESTNTQA